ncbi:MAG: porin [Acidobacteria bacterium]|nr:MAG: porin [Acidobacteriota bacterium]
MSHRRVFTIVAVLVALPAAGLPRPLCAQASGQEPAGLSAGKDGFSVTSADGAYQLRLKGLVQEDGRFFDADRQKPASDTFLMRRARPILEATLAKIFDVRIAPDFGQGQTVLFDAYLEVRFRPAARLRAGKFKPPVGLERLQAASDTLFVERALPSGLVPNRDVGVQLSGDLFGSRLSYALGAFNGTVDGGNGDADSNDGKEAAARVFVTPFAKSAAGWAQGIGFGVGATYGNTHGTPASTGVGGYKTAGQQAFFTYRSDGKTLAATVIGEGRRSRIAPQAWYYVGRFGAIAEYVRSKQEVALNGVAGELADTAWQVTASFLLTGDKASFKGVSPRKPFDKEAHTWGALELVARAGRWSIDDKAFPVFADPAASARRATERGAGVNWYLTRNVRLMLDYVETRFEGGDVAGDREDEKVLLDRLQISF